MGKLILITGGARSGKSGFAEKLILKKTKQSPAAYIATGEGFDSEFQNRIELHQTQRKSSFVTIEENLKISEAVEKSVENYSAAMLECITTWLGNVFFHISEAERENFAQREIEKIFLILGRKKSYTLAVVSNELGMGLVPADAESRLYRDIHGRINQMLAVRAEEVYLTVSGIPLRIKP